MSCRTTCLLLITVLSLGCHSASQDAPQPKATPFQCAAEISPGPFDPRREEPWVGVIDLSASTFSSARLAGLERLYAISAISSDVLAVGRSNSQRAWVARINVASGPAWQRSLDGTHLQKAQFTAIQQPSASAEIALAGEGLSDGRWMILVGLIDETGNWSWKVELQSDFDERYPAVVRCGDGSVVVAAHLLPRGLVIYRLDRNGNVMWRRAMPTAPISSVRGIQQLQSGGFLVSAASGGVSQRTVLVRLIVDAQGNPTSEATDLAFYQCGPTTLFSTQVADTLISVGSRPSGGGQLDWQTLLKVGREGQGPTATRLFPVETTHLTCTLDNAVWMAGWRMRDGRPLTVFIRLDGSSVGSVVCIDMGWAGPGMKGFRAAPGRLLLGGGNLEGRPH